MGGVPLPSERTRCSECGRSLSAKTAPLVDGDGCPFCRGEDDGG